MQHATGRVERPGKSQEALEGKKIVAFSNLVAVFHSCAASHPNSFVKCTFRRHGRLKSCPHGFVWFLFGLAPAPVLCCFANLAGRFACRRCCRVSFCCLGFSIVCLVSEAKGFYFLHTFLPLLSRTKPWNEIGRNRGK